MVLTFNVILGNNYKKISLYIPLV